MSELVFDITQEADGGYVAMSIGENIVTEGDTWQELRDNVQDAVKAYFHDGVPPDYVRLHLEVIEHLAIA